MKVSITTIAGAELTIEYQNGFNIFLKWPVGYGVNCSFEGMTAEGVKKWLDVLVIQESIEYTDALALYDAYLEKVTKDNPMLFVL